MSDYATKSFWLASQPYQENPPLAGSINADVAIVGGGFTGMSTAYYLKKAEPNQRVVVLESDVVGFGASGRNGGFAMTLMGLMLSTTAFRFGKEKARIAHDFGHRAVEHLGEMVAEHSIDCDYEKPGLFTVATSPAQVKRLQGEIRLGETLGVKGLRWLDASELREEVASPTYLGARYEDQCALVNPAKLVRGMKVAAEKVGAEIYERTPVLTFRPGRALWLETPRGQVEAKKIVFATNAFSGRFPQLQAKAFSVYTYIVLTEPLSPQQMAPIGWGGRQGIEDARNLIHYYRLTADNRLLMGGEDALLYLGGPLDRDYHAPTFRRLERHIVKTFPSLANARIEYRWGGPVSVPIDFFPAIGYVGNDKRVVYSLGCVGHGVAMTTYLGQLLRDLVLERRTDLSELFWVNRRVIPLPPEPMRFALGDGLRRALAAQDAWEARKT